MLLGPEGDRLDALAAMHGVVAGLALALAKRLATCGTRRMRRQARAFVALATALARGFYRRDEPDFEAEIAPALVELMRWAGAQEREGVRHESLVKIPAGWPLRGLAINPAALALAAVMRLRHALQENLINAGEPDPRRAAQLRVIRNIEAEVVVIAQDIERHAITAMEALRRVRKSLAAAEGALEPADIAALLGDEAAGGADAGLGAVA